MIWKLLFSQCFLKSRLIPAWSLTNVKVWKFLGKENTFYEQNFDFNFIKKNLSSLVYETTKKDSFNDNDCQNVQFSDKNGIQVSMEYVLF